MPLSALSLTLDTPAQATPNSPVTLTGTYQGNPQSLDYNFGSGWIQASPVIFSGGIFSFTVPGGFAAGSYRPEIRDHFTPTVAAVAGAFVVDPWTPTALKTSPGATAVFEFNASNPAVVAVAGDSTVHTVLNSLDPSESLTVRVASGGNGVVLADSSGADGTRRLLQFHATTIIPAIYDPATEWLSAGGVSGTAGSALVKLADSSNLSVDGAFTTVIALKIDKRYTYEAGPIWGALAVPGPLQYAQIRFNNGSGYAGAQIYGATAPGAAAQSGISEGWHVMTMIKSGGAITYRLDGQPIATAAVTSTEAFTASDFMIGGGFPPTASPYAGKENGVPPPYIGEFQAYSGALAGTDLAEAEKLAGNSIGLSLTPFVPPPPQVVVLGTGGNSFMGGAGALIVTDNHGGNTITGGAGSFSLVDNGGNDVITTGTSATNSIVLKGAGVDVITVLGATALSAGASSSRMTLRSGGSSITGGTGALTITDSAGGNTIRGGTGGLNLVATAGKDVITTNGPANTLILGGASATAVTANGTTNIVAGGGNLTVTGDGNLSINGGMGSMTITGGAGSEYVFTQNATKNLLKLGSGNASILSHGVDTINAGSGTAAVYAGGAALINGGSGALSASGHDRAITVNGGIGAVRASTGIGGGYITGGSSGHNVLAASAGNATLVGGGDGDTLTDAATTGSVTLVAGPGAETLIGGSASDLFVLVNSNVTHSAVIRGFTPGTDHLHFAGFGSSGPIAAQAVVAGSLQLTLADNAHVTLIGVTNLGSGDVV